MEEFVLPEKCIWEKDSYNTRYGKLTVEPLYRGFGITLGNALRRVLLSCVPGVAITGLRVEGVSHEFSTIEGVKEDLTEVVLNLKQICLKPIVSQFPQTLRVEIRKAGEILAKDLFVDGSVEVLNGELHIATLTASRPLRLELTITKGYGYVPVEKFRVMKRQMPAETISLDGIYSPVRKVTFHVESTRVGQSVDYEKLILEVWTTGAVSPEESVSVATKLLNQHFSLITEKQTVGEKKPGEKGPIDASQPSEGTLDIPISELKLSTRVENALLSRNIATLRGLLNTPREEFSEIKNLGKKSLEEIEAALKQRGYTLRTAEEIESGEKTNETQEKNL
ncbi:MAG: DNA-directed RNA polymerase subunit alpha [Candidatus Omnitrophica bacterium]|nr:DNA-directed RNA polymerase subunit alpha [Candidatus Omnitrophota bacterium]